MSAAKIQPTAQKLSRRTTTLPLLLASTLSETNVEATGSSPPSPIPIKNRSIKNKLSVLTAADRPLAIENNNNVMIKTFFRPTLSAIAPKKTAPTAIPMEFMLPIQPTCSLVKFQSCFNATMMKESIPTSSASNIHPRPATPSNLRCDIIFALFPIYSS